jgi:hypothetical protein
MSRSAFARSALAAALAGASQLALAAEESGTSAVGEMQVTGTTLLLILAGVCGVGLVLYLVTKLMK